MCQVIQIDFKTKTLQSVTTTLHSSPDFDIYQFKNHLPKEANPFFDLVQTRLNKAVKGISKFDCFVFSKQHDNTYDYEGVKFTFSQLTEVIHHFQAQNFIVKTGECGSNAFFLDLRWS